MLYTMLYGHAAHIVHNKKRTGVLTFDLCFQCIFLHSTETLRMEHFSAWWFLAGLSTKLATEPLVAASKTELPFKMAD